jgi:predicted  nucleic acid-binding Zn-ribbon protein
MQIRYPLEALVKIRQWELDLLRQKMTDARDAVTAAEVAVERLGYEIAGAETELTQNAVRGRIISVHQRMLLVTFVKDRRAQLLQDKIRLEGEKNRMSEVMDEMTSVRRALRAVERHRERFLDDLSFAAKRNAEKGLDDMWSSRSLVLNHE